MSKSRLLNLIARLIHKRGEVNTYAIAFILTEMRFRGPLFRTCEVIYAYWLIYVTHREPNLTLGKCQVSFKHWRTRFGNNNLRMLFAFFDDLDNYAVCCDYLNLNPTNDPTQAIIRYNGRPSPLYASLFRKNFELCNWAVKHLNK